MKYSVKKTTQLAKRFAAEYAAGEYDSFNEADTVHHLVVPFLQSFGWDENVSFQPYVSEIRKFPDLVLKTEGTARVVMEVKRVEGGLSNHIPQLEEYFNHTSAHIGILTNGIQYWFFSWNERSHYMNCNPYAIIDIRHIDLKKNDSFMQYFSRKDFNTTFFKWFSHADYVNGALHRLFKTRMDTNRKEMNLAKKVFFNFFLNYNYAASDSSDESNGDSYAVTYDKKLTKKQIKALYDYTHYHSRWRYRNNKVLVDPMK